MTKKIVPDSLATSKMLEILDVAFVMMIETFII